MNFKAFKKFTLPWVQSYGLWILIFIPYHLSWLWVDLISVQFSGWGKYFVQIWLRPPTSYLNASLSLAFPMPLATSRLKSTESAVLPFNRWMTIPKFWPKPIPRLFSEAKFSKTKAKTFFRDQIFRNWNQYFFPRPNFPKLKPILFFRDQILQNRNFFPRPNSLKPRLFFRY